MKQIPILKSIETEQFSINPALLKDRAAVSVETHMDFGISEDFTCIVTKGIFRYVEADNELLRLEIDCSFAVGSEQVDDIKENGLVDREYLLYLGSITVGTARGVIHAKTVNTALAGLVLPQINLTKIVEGDFILPKKE